MSILIFLCGLVVGSFISAYSYRYPRGIRISDGRSKCPKCHKIIRWYHNVPVFSYLILGGKCARCKKKISARYPAIELGTGVIFFVIEANNSRIWPNLPWLYGLGVWGMVLLLFITSSVIAVFVIDLESQLIPDEATFLMFLFVVIALLTNPGIYVYLLSGFGAGLFLLFIHLITKGRGMGLGDVKMVVPLGALLGPRLSVVWIFGAFVIGGLVGIVLLASRSVAWRSRVAFGPFLVVSFFITLFFGSVIASWILPV